MYGFLLRFASNFMTYKPSKSQWPWLWPSRSFKVKWDGVITISIYGVLIIYIVTTCPSLTLQFIHRVQWWTLNFRKKKSLKIINSNFQNSKTVLLWGPLTRKLRKSLKDSKVIWGRSSVLKVLTPIGNSFHIFGRETNSHSKTPSLCR